MICDSEKVYHKTANIMCLSVCLSVFVCLSLCLRLSLSLSLCVCMYVCMCFALIFIIRTQGYLHHSRTVPGIDVMRSFIEIGHISQSARTPTHIRTHTHTHTQIHKYTRTYLQLLPGISSYTYSVCYD